MEAIRSKGSCLSEASFLVLVLNYGGWDLGHDWSSPRLGGPGRFGGRGEEGEEPKCSGVARWVGGDSPVVVEEDVRLRLAIEAAEFCFSLGTWADGLLSLDIGPWARFSVFGFRPDCL